MKSGYIDGLFNLSGKTVFVTGALGQLGRAICKSYKDAGAKVIGADKEAVKERTSGDACCEYIVMDISDKSSVLKAFEYVYKKHERIDVLINNAGVSVFEPFDQRLEESFDFVTDVNLKGTFLCIQAYVKYAAEKKHSGNIINIASIYGVVSPDFRIYTDCSRRNSEVYGATKAGIIQMTKYFAVHLARQDIRVNCVSPGGIFNPDAPQGEDFVKNYSQRCPMGRMADAKDIIGALLYLSSDAAGYTTGQNIIIDGGTTCW